MIQGAVIILDKRTKAGFKLKVIWKDFSDDPTYAERDYSIDEILEALATTDLIKRLKVIEGRLYGTKGKKT